MEFGTPKHVMKINERIFKPRNEGTFHKFLKCFLWIVLISIAVASLIFRENIFSYLPLSFYVVMLAIAAKVIIEGGNERVPSPLELWIYDEYMIFYRPKLYYHKNLQKRRYQKLYYKDITDVHFNIYPKRFVIMARVELETYDYRKDGTLPETPTKHLMHDRGMCDFFVMPQEEEAVLKELQEWLPVAIRYV